MVMIKDVVKYVGVFIIIVLYVINKICFVVENIKVVVWVVIKELYYLLSVVVCSLKVNYIKLIGLLVIFSEVFYFVEVIEVVENSCYSKGYILILCNFYNNLDK